MVLSFQNKNIAAIKLIREIRVASSLRCYIVNLIQATRTLPEPLLAQSPLPPRARLIVLTRTYLENTYREWQRTALSRPFTHLVLDQGTESPPAGVNHLFPGWLKNRELARLVMGPLWEVE